MTAPHPTNQAGAEMLTMSADLASNALMTVANFYICALADQKRAMSVALAQGMQMRNAYQSLCSEREACAKANAILIEQVKSSEKRMRRAAKLISMAFDPGIDVRSSLRDALVELTSVDDALQESSAAEAVPREGVPGRDFLPSGRGVGSGGEGQKAPEEETESEF